MTALEEVELLLADPNTDWRVQRILRRGQDAQFDLWRVRCLVRDEFKCRRCGKRPKDWSELHVHHKRDPKLRLVTSNGMTLCVKCHPAVERMGRGTLFYYEREWAKQNLPP